MEKNQEWHQRSSQMILTAGPSITRKEIELVTDAVATGWNSNWSYYLNKFETDFKSFVGAPYAMATSSCTGAMHLALKALGVGPGDEVIVPEITWIATASAVTYVGAKPVFCDVDPETWTMDPESVQSNLSSRTKGIMPVHIYGHPCEMEPLYQICEKNNLFILEDAAQSIGATYNGRFTGSLGDAAAFSFQGAKAMVTGEGGILLMKDEELFAKARYYGDHGRDPNKTLFNTSIGYKYKMSNMQAALGCAQMMRINEIVEKKRQIFDWYRIRLEEIEEVSLNAEKPWAKNIYWMTSMVLPKGYKLSREEFCTSLKELNVDSRPVFYPISSFPMFDTQENPVSRYVGTHGINLPSGHNLTEEEVDYVCNSIKEVMGLNKAPTTLKGSVLFKNKILETIRSLKEDGRSIEFNNFDGEKYFLSPLSKELVKNNPSITKLFMEWRSQNQEAFLDRFEVTEEGTSRWVDNLINSQKDRILFMIQTESGEFLGHIGLFRFDFLKSFCEIDNVVRGVKEGPKGLMSSAQVCLENWAKNELGLKNLFLRVLGKNVRAVNFYEKLDYVEVCRVPLYLEKQGGVTSLRSLHFPDYESPEDYFITMKKKS